MDQTIIFALFREKIKAFAVFTDEEWEFFSRSLKTKSIPKNHYFVESGTTCRELAFIIKGAVRFCNVIEGREVTGYFTFEGNFVTALKSYLSAEPALYDIKTVADSCFVTISRKEMLRLSEHPVLACKIERMGRMISERFNLLFEDRLKSFIIKTPEERYLDLLESGREIVQRMPLQYVAQFIGITPVSLSRIRKRILVSAAK